MLFYRQCYQCFESFKRVTGDGELKGETVIVGEDEPLFGYVQLADVPFVDDKSFTYANKCGGLFAQLLVKSKLKIGEVHTNTTSKFIGCDYITVVAIALEVSYFRDTKP